MCKWPSQAYLSIFGLLQGYPLNSQDVLKQHFTNFLNAGLHLLNKQTNKQTWELMSGTNTPKTSVCAHLVRLYKILLRFVLRPIASEIMWNIFFFPLASGQTITLRRFFELVYIFHRSWINLSIQWKQRRVTPGFCRG